jgi:O-antigen ligase
MSSSFNLEKTYHYLLATLAFFIPLTVFGANLVIVFICLLWIFSGGFKAKFMKIKESKLMIASISFFLIHVVGLIWTEDLSWGLHITHKMWYFVGLFPILFTIVKRENLRKYISAFLFAILITEVFSYLIWFELIEPFKNASLSNPTPFMSHISYNPILAFAIYLVAHEILFNKKITLIRRNLFIFFIFSMSLNMFITGGRAGQVMFFAVLILLIFQYFNKNRIRAALVALFMISTIFYSAYQFSEIFNNRVNDAVISIANYETDKHTSVGLRITFALNSFEVIRNNLFFGVGTGDLPSAYKNINKINTPELPNTSNPHNMYILVLMQNGMLGLFGLILIFYYQIKLSLGCKDQFFRDVGLSLPILFLLIMLSESYLLGHFTSLLYIFFSAFLHQDIEKY